MLTVILLLLPRSTKPSINESLMIIRLNLLSFSGSSLSMTEMLNVLFVCPEGIVTLYGPGI